MKYFSLYFTHIWTGNTHTHTKLVALLIVLIINGCCFDLAGVGGF